MGLNINDILLVAMTAGLVSFSSSFSSVLGGTHLAQIVPPRYCTYRTGL